MNNKKHLIKRSVDTKILVTNMTTVILSETKNLRTFKIKDSSLLRAGRQVIQNDEIIRINIL